MNVTTLAKDILESAEFWTSPECPFQVKLHQADEKLLVIAGSNASGKSLFFQFMSVWAKEDKTLPVSISIRERTGSGLSEMASMRRAMMFGREDEQSTGACSVSVVQTGFKNVVDRKAMLMLDEPDMGLSEDYAHAFGRLLVQEHQRCVAKNEDYQGLVVVTHSRNLVEGMLAEDAQPSFLAAGVDATLAQWLTSRKHRSLEELLALEGHANAQFRVASRMLKTR